MLILISDFRHASYTVFEKKQLEQWKMHRRGVICHFGLELRTIPLDIFSMPTLTP